MNKSIDTATENRIVRYGVYHPTKGWLRLSTFLPCWQSVPFLTVNHKKAKRRAAYTKSQLVTFDVIPCLRSWPGEEADASK